MSQPPPPRARRRRRLTALVAALAMPAGYLTVAVAPTAHAAGTAYYVDCSQSSNGDGTQGSPWNSLATVNDTMFGPGDQILFDRGSTCDGTLAPQGSGASGAPIVIDAYGTGAKPIIAGGGAPDAILLFNQQYWEIRDLEVTNEGGSSANRRGVHIVLRDYGTGNYYRITDLTVHNVNGDNTKDLEGSAGIQFDVLGNSVKTKFNDVVVSGNDVYTVDRSGINMSTTWKCRASINWPAPCTPGVVTYYPWTGFVVQNNSVHDIGGDGIVMQYTQNGLAQNNVAYDVADRPHGSNAGIWDWNADDVTFQYNEAYDIQKLSDNGDGMAWDADYGTNGTVYQYNYSHDNVGGMAMFCGCGGGSSSTDNAVFRYNVSQNDSGQVLRDAGEYDGAFYNNTIYEPSGSTAGILTSGGPTLTVANNIIVNNGSGGWGYDSATTFTDNIISGNTSGAPSGQIYADPQLVSPGSGGTGSGTASGYKLTAGSPAIGAGAVIANNGGKDFWGDPVPTYCAPDIGADQYSTPDDAACAPVQNGGFETGAITPWTKPKGASVVTGNAHAGTYALQIGTSQASAQQVVTVAPNTTYQLTGWAKASNSSAQARIGVKSYGGNEVYSSISGTTYTNAALTFRTGPTSTQATVYCAQSGGSGYAYCDDLAVAAAQAPVSEIVGSGSGRCVDVPNKNSADGTQFDLWDCNNGTNQSFSRYSDGTLRTMGKCLTAASNASLAAVTISTCTGAAGQSWTYNASNDELSPYSGMCMDASGAGTGNGTSLILYACSGNSNQQWTMQQPGYSPAPVSTAITVDGTKTGLTFDGVGALSAGGGNSRLLIDYPEPERSQILDYLFKPGYGASLQILKLEIGGDGNSTDGAEATHETTKGVIDCNQGFEWWLAAQAKARNPNIKIVALSWTAPGWVGDGSNTFYTPDAITYLMDWMGCAAKHNLTVDYIGGWNERYNGYAGNNSAGAMPWYESLKSALVAHGYSTKVIAGDDGWSVADDMVANPSFNAAVDVVGVHYPCGYLGSGSSCPSTSNAESLGKPLWASENGSEDATDGAAATARAINRDYIDGHMTGYINWPLAAALYPNLAFSTDGLVIAQQPWSGNYLVGPTTWVMAQTTQFTAPGWHYIDSASGALGGSASNGTYVTLKSTNNSDYSTIIETMDAGAAQTATFNVTGGLSTGTVHVWATDVKSPNAADNFVHQADITPTAGSYSLTLEPGYVYTVTTTSTVPGTTAAQGRGVTSPPAAAPLALPYSDNFETPATTTSPKYFSDMNGAFATVPCDGTHTGTCLQQMATATPVRWTGESYDDPYTMMGDISWGDYTVSVDTDLTQAGSVEILGRVNQQAKNNNGLNAYHLRVSDTGAWSILKSDTSWNFTTLASGTTTTLGTNSWHTIALTMQGTTLTATIDGKAVGSATDGSYAQGMAGLGVVGYQTDQFDDFSVTAAGSAESSHVGQVGSVLNPAMCLDTNDGSEADGTIVQLWNCNGSAGQSWTYTNQNLIINGKCLDVTNASSANGTLVDLWDCNGGANQKWTAGPNDTLISGLSSGSSTVCLDDPGAYTVRATQLEIWSCNGGANQNWALP